MFTKVLIANRGEIACRIIRTLDRLEIASVVVYSDPDLASLAVEQAGESLSLPGSSASETYLDSAQILEAALKTGAQAIHPGYGFLSENAAFALACQAAGIVFIGPTPENMEIFGLKHRAREAALAAGVPLLPGTGLLESATEAQAEAIAIGFPVILKSTGGGGGIGMRICWNQAELSQAWDGVLNLAQRNFRDSGLYLEKFVARARHIEVQVFGDGRGGIAILGDRDCSAQRRNQKVVEETPAPGLSAELRRELHEAARRLTASANYANAGTVEFVFDVETNQFYFLEVNTRLQVEHTITEEVWGVDLVEWMLLQAAGAWSTDLAANLMPRGHAFQARLYAEDPGRNFQPCAGLVTQASWPPSARVETWIRGGLEMTTNYDPLLAKIITYGDSRAEALQGLRSALENTRIGGLQSNRAWLTALLGQAEFVAGTVTTALLGSVVLAEAAFEVLKPGTQTTIQDWPGRAGLWKVGIPPSGPMDSLSFRLGNRLLGNSADAAGLEITLTGPTLKFRNSIRLCLTGAPFQADLDGTAIGFGRVFAASAGQVLTIKGPIGGGQRAYLTFAGGLDVPAYLGSRSTFTLGGFGGHGGRALLAGDVVPWNVALENPGKSVSLPVAGQSSFNLNFPGDFMFSPGWDPRQIRVMYGPQGAPDFFKLADIGKFLATDWEVHFNSSRTGIRLMGPVPDWPRADGGEAGLHPSNLHDNPYSPGAMDFTGDMPILLGPDGPSLGGFVCPFTVVTADLWKMGQLKGGDRVRFRAVSLEQARQANTELERFVETLVPPEPNPVVSIALEPPILFDRIDPEGRAVVVRASGDRRLLLEIGDHVLDLELRLAIHWWSEQLERSGLAGIIELTPGIRSLQIHYDDVETTREQLLAWFERSIGTMPSLDSMEVPSRTVWLPLSWDDPATRLAIQKYMATVRPDAPWCPWNIEFIRRINGLESWETVRDILFSAEYLVLGLGDVYLGAPVATPTNPAHRLVTTKYNPARTWTPENAVGIGGAYLCVYGMEGPGGYQFVGRTIQMWNRFFVTADFNQPWLLRWFDRIRFFPVSTGELALWRRDFPLGRRKLEITEGRFRWAEYRRFLEENQGTIATFKQVQSAAFAQERQDWKDTGQDSFQALPAIADPGLAVIPPGASVVDSPVTGSVWQIAVTKGQPVRAGDLLAIFESMKMEIRLEAPVTGQVVEILAKPGDSVRQGQAIIAYIE